jgi:amino acid adenylation domain-containing protein
LGVTSSEHCDLPPGLTDALHALAVGAEVGDLAPLAVCAGVLTQRLLRPGAGCAVRVVAGADEAVLPADGGPDLSAGFRDALADAVRPGCAEPATVALRIPADGRYLHAETLIDTSDGPSAAAWARSARQLLTAMAKEPDAPLRSHPLVGHEERERILHGLNPFRVPEIAYRTMAEPFQEQAERTPNAVALLDEDGTTLTYRELNERSNRLAHHLRAHGAGPGTRIGVCLRRSIHQIVAIHAAVKTGAAYVPIDADLPDQRLEWMLGHADPRHVLTDPACRARVPAGAWELVDVCTEAHVWRDRPTTNIRVAGTATALLHLLYTSGTTGRPKGVATQTVSGLANLFWMQQQYPFDEGGTALYKASPGFDISIWEIFWPLYHGARVVVCRPGAERDPRHLANLTAEHDVSLVFLVPTMMPAFLQEIPPAGTTALRWVICGGEPMSPRIPETFRATLPASTLVNAFGPTEAGPVTDNVVAPEWSGLYVPIGRPADNFRVTLLDGSLDLVPIGAPGEAFISGEAGLADGYWQATARTAERFVADPYGPPGTRMYRTGDLCRFREDGALEHLGRIDRQIKIRGLRVEPGEIESVLAAHPAVRDCAVVAHGQPARLLAFVVPAGQLSAADVNRARILDRAGEVLPRHMCPERVVPVERIPATVNGKIDQAELIAVWQGLVERERNIVPPADELEAALVEIYCRVLDTAPISMLDTFVALGGHSMLTFRLYDECTAALQAAPDVPDLFTGTLRDVAAIIRERRVATEPFPSPQ